MVLSEISTGNTNKCEKSYSVVNIYTNLFFSCRAKETRSKCICFRCKRFQQPWLLLVNIGSNIPRSGAYFYIVVLTRPMVYIIMKKNSIAIMSKMFPINDSYTLNLNKYFGKTESTISIDESESDLVHNATPVGQLRHVKSKWKRGSPVFIDIFI